MIIDVKNVSMQYRINKDKYVLALDDISYSIKAGETVGLIGLNGAGKSSTIKLLTGIMKPTAGRINILRQDPFKYRKEVCKKYGVMFGQRSQLWWDLPVKDSFYINGSVYGMSRKQVDKKIQFFKEWLELDYLEVPVRKLSLGQRVMCDILVSMLHEPEILFLDEATIALDVLNRRNILEMISKINKELGTTLIITSHQLDDIESVCDRILLLNKGKLFYDGALKDFLNDSKYSKVLSVQVVEVEAFKKEIKLLTEAHGIFTMYKGHEVNLFFENNEEIFEKAMQFLSISSNVDTFVIRGITLEERILLMKG